MTALDAMLLLVASTWYWTAGEFLGFAIGYLWVQGKLGGVIKSILKVVLTVVIVFVVVTIAGLYIINYKTNPKAVATVTNVVNSDFYGGYSQELTLEYKYNDAKYVVEDVSTINLCADVGDKYIVHFSSRNPTELDFINTYDKFTPGQAFLSSIKYAIAGIIIFLILVKIVKSKL